MHISIGEKLAYRQAERRLRPAPPAVAVEKCAILENALPVFILKAQLFETMQKYKGIIVSE